MDWFQIEAIQVIDAAIARVKQGWTQRVNARNAEGKEVNPVSSTACRWCLVGALYRGTEDVGASRITTANAINALNECGPSQLTTWNDTTGRTPAEVVKLLEKAKERLETED